MKKLIYALAILFFVSCSKTENTGELNVDGNRAVGRLFEYIINPSTTNRNIILYNNPHYVYLDTRVTAKNRLFVFLPGTSGSPSVYKLIEKKAAALGYHSIGLMYPNGSEMYTASTTNPDNTSFGRCRQETFDGTNQTLALNINADNCIRGRLTKLLQYLVLKYPSQGWGQYLVSGQVAWSKVILAGHSQGGGHAFYISKKVNLAKAISFASMDWNTLLGRSAAWIADPALTPVANMYSFISPRDQVFNYNNVQTQLNELGIQGTATSIDNIASPYGNTRRLITNTTPAITLLVPDHNITCLDQYVPKTSTGAVVPAFDNAWGYLLNN